MTATLTTDRIGPYPIGASCPWRNADPATLTPIAKTLELARTRQWMRDVLATLATREERAA
jgi:hypothetical protein